MADKLNELRRERAEVVRRMEKLTDESRWTDAVKRKFEEVENEARSLDAQIAALEGVKARKHYLAQPAPGSASLPLGFDLATATDATPAHPKSCRSLFGAAADRGGFESWTDFVVKFENRPADGARGDEARAMLSSVGSDGGFLVPEAFAQTILDSGLEDECVRPDAQVWPVERAGSIKVPGWDGSDHSSSLYGGFTANWSAENTTLSETDAQVRQVELDPKKISILTSVTRELEQDSISGFAGYLQNALAKALSFNIDDAFLNGSGVGRPLGIMNADCLVEVGAEDGQVGDTLVLENLAKMYSRMLPASVRRAKWYIHPSCVPQLLTLSLSVGTGGSAYPVMEANGGLYIFNRPVVISEKMQPLGDKGCVLFADMGWYGIAIAQELRIDKSMHVHWTTDKSAYKIVARVDGQPLLDSPITPLYGTDTLSPFVTLEAV